MRIASLIAAFTLTLNSLAMAQSALENGQRFLKENAEKPGVKTTSSGLQYKVLREGSGKTPAATDIVVVNYRGTLINGKEFLADLLRGKLVPSVHIVGRESRQIKGVLRQRCFFVRQRTMLRNRIHRLLGAQHEVKLSQCSDLFGRKGLSFLDKLELEGISRAYP